MDSRRDFIKKAALLAGSGLGGALPLAIQKAFAIDPPRGTTYLDAEHVVILMQENRSFDHCYGMLRGVRGFNDPRAITLPNGNPVWLQNNAAGETYAPFRLNIKDTKATWMGSLPHSWVDQVDARNDGKHDQWLVAKVSGHKENEALPLTLGFYNRDDLPFYYALADAFTVCDQNFCSSLTGTTPNRLYLWTGTIREQASILSKANVRNEDVDYGAEATWKTFPERLEEQGISWRVYQNELSLATGFEGDEDAWLANFTDNPLEWFTQFHVRFHPAHRRHLAAREKVCVREIQELEALTPLNEEQQKKLRTRKAELEDTRRALVTWTEANFNQLPAAEQNLHRKAFTTNTGDADYRALTSLTYLDGPTTRQMQVPKGDVLHQFREDVRTGKLPAVSWLVAPERFSDHPGAPWYGAWYLSETLDILTQNPEVWKKTIFILCYDENDGYYDHVPPFVPPHPEQPGTGKVSPGIDTSVEFVRPEQEAERQRQHPGSRGRSGPIGLGFRVPLVIASPWSRGGFVCSQVFDHTSILQLLEKWLSHKSGKAIQETNISAWRRTVCGDLTSVFRPYNGEKVELPTPVEREKFLGSIDQAQFKPLPNGFRRFTPEDVAQAQRSPAQCEWLPRQEKGARPSCALPYELAVEGKLSEDGKRFEIRFAAGKEQFGPQAAGAPFHVYAPGKTRSKPGASEPWMTGRTWAYAVTAGDQLRDSWALEDFADGQYHLRVHGPNGFYREFRGSAADPAVEVALRPARAGGRASGNAELGLRNPGKLSLSVTVEDVAYGGQPQRLTLPAGGKEVVAHLDLVRSGGWYDARVTISGQAGLAQRWAGRIETGRDSFSDPQLDQG